MKWLVVDDHVIPPEEAQEHEPANWCQCQPQPIYDAKHNLWWEHRYFDNTPQLLRDAENIKNQEAVKLWQNAELRGLKVKVMPFTQEKIYTPKQSYRKENEQ